MLQCKRVLIASVHPNPDMSCVGLRFQGRMTTCWGSRRRWFKSRPWWSATARSGWPPPTPIWRRCCGTRPTCRKRRSSSTPPRHWKWPYLTSEDDNVNNNNKKLTVIPRCRLWSRRLVYLNRLAVHITIQPFSEPTQCVILSEESNITV